MLIIARIIAIGVGLSTFIFLFPLGSWRADNIFLIPDLILSPALIIAALLPARIARPALLLALGFASGVLITAGNAYAVRGEFGLAQAGAGLVLVAAVLTLLTTVRRNRTES